MKENINRKPEKMKRYLAFYGDEYYPDYGMKDLLCDADTQEEAEQAIKQKVNTELASEFCDYESEANLWEYRYAQVYDSENMKIVFEK